MPLRRSQPILKLPPIETVTVNVEFSVAEREFYNSLLEKSQAVFEGFIRNGTATKSWFAIFSLLNRLRQTCDHVALTVKSQLNDDEWNPDTLEMTSPGRKKVASPAAKRTPKASNDNDALGDEVSSLQLIVPFEFVSISCTILSTPTSVHPL